MREVHGSPRHCTLLEPGPQCFVFVCLAVQGNFSELGLKRLDLFASALVHGITTEGGVLNETHAHVLGLELSVIVVVGAAGILSAKTAAGVRDLLASELVVGGRGLSATVLVGEEAELW